MMYRPTVSASVFLTVFLSLIQKAKADTSLYLPGTDDDAQISASVLGTDSNGHTSWFLSEVSPTDTADSPIVTAVLVEGSTDAVLTATFEGVSAVESCGYASIGAVASCVITEGGDIGVGPTTIVLTTSETASARPVLTGAASAPSGTTATTSGGFQTSVTPAPGQGTTSTGSNTSSAPASTQSTKSGAEGLSSSISLLVLVGCFSLLI